MPGHSVAINLDAVFADRYFEIGLSTVILAEIVHAEANHAHQQRTHQEIQKAVRIRV
jgi:hypothetical protein